MMSGKEKLYFLLNRIDDARAIAPSGRPILLHPANDLNNNFRDIELAQLLAKLQTDENVLQVLKIPNEVLGELLRATMRKNEKSIGLSRRKLKRKCLSCDLPMRNTI